MDHSTDENRAESKLLRIAFEKQDSLTVGMLKDALEYDPDTGVFVRKVRSSNVKAGSVAGSIRHGYTVINVHGKRYLAHRLAWLYVYGGWPCLYIDHINGNGLDNRISNLRLASDRMNRENLRAARSDNKSSGLLGAHWSAYHKKWKSHIRTGGRLIHLGYFATKEEAHAAYLEAKRRLHPGCTI